VAPTDLSVLVVGETGTGKELVARELHRRSPRGGGPFVAINCGALPETLLESELFGHVKGAFTGAVATRPGRFQQASGGTLFLDEVGDMPPVLQVKLLRALQDRTVQKVGDHREEPVDIRVLAATHRTLEDEVKRGTFREDLYYRLATLTLRVPPLRDRGEDMVVLARGFLRTFADAYRPAASPRPRCPPSAAIPGRGTSGSWRTGSRRRWSSPTARWSAPRIWTSRPRSCRRSRRCRRRRTSSSAATCSRP
jgi:transcriptional regulator with GAF, ATPase, and Fis domain